MQIHDERRRLPPRIGLFGRRNGVVMQIHGERCHEVVRGLPAAATVDPDAAVEDDEHGVGVQRCQDSRRAGVVGVLGDGDVEDEVDEGYEGYGGG